MSPPHLGWGWRWMGCSLPSLWLLFTFWLGYTHLKIRFGSCVQHRGIGERGKIVRISPNWNSLFAPVQQKPARNLILLGFLWVAAFVCVGLRKEFELILLNKSSSFLFKEAIRIERGMAQSWVWSEIWSQPCLGG